MNSIDKTKRPDTEPMIRSAAWGWVALAAMTVAILAAAYFLKP